MAHGPNNTREYIHIHTHTPLGFPFPFSIPVHCCGASKQESKQAGFVRVPRMTNGTDGWCVFSGCFPACGRIWMGGWMESRIFIYLSIYLCIYSLALSHGWMLISFSLPPCQPATPPPPPPRIELPWALSVYLSRQATASLSYSSYW